jgi:hypothetical protein
MRIEGNARTWFTPKQKAELWERWKSGQCVAGTVPWPTLGDMYRTLLPGKPRKTLAAQALSYDCPGQPPRPTNRVRILPQCNQPTSALGSNAMANRCNEA